jgi:hypothetical protein
MDTTVYATCHTDDCGNAGAPIMLRLDEIDLPPNVVCGVCSQPISDISIEQEPKP